MSRMSFQHDLLCLLCTQINLQLYIQQGCIPFPITFLWIAFSTKFLFASLFLMSEECKFFIMHGGWYLPRPGFGFFCNISQISPYCSGIIWNEQRNVRPAIWLIKRAKLDANHHSRTQLPAVWLWGKPWIVSWSDWNSLCWSQIPC